MRLFNREVFRGTAYSTTQYTPAEFNGLLGSADRLTFQVIGSRASGAVTLNIDIEHSSDNEHWVAYQASGTLSVSLVAGQLNVAYTGEKLLDTGLSTRGAFVRLAIFLPGGGDADVVVIATGRSV